MAYRYGNNRNDRNFGGNDRGGNYGGGAMNRNINPWGNDGGNQGGGGGGGNNYRQNQGGNMNNDVLSLANSLVNNILRGNQPPSLLDLPNNNMRGGGGGGGGGNQGGGYGRFNDQMGRMGGNRNLNANRNRRSGGPTPRKSGNLVKGGIRKGNAQDRTKKVMAKNNTSNNNSKQQNAESTDLIKTESTKNDKNESVYTDVPNDMFYCHLCKKHMWDATSFENHIKGRTHLMMKEGVEESYRLKANMIRQEAKIEEQLKAIELDRLKRMGKNMKASNMRREYCTMCDLHFYGHLSAHRKTEGHLNLKKFLHPKCTDCNQEFPTRIDYDSHVLAPEHMKNVHTTKSGKPEKRRNQLVILGEEDETKDLKEKEEKKEKKAKDKDAAAADGVKVEGEEGAEAKEDAEMVDENGEKVEGEEKASEPAAEPEPEPADVILDWNEGDEIPIEVEAKIPKYDKNRSIGFSLIHKLDCYECQLCGRFFDTEKTAEIHSRTITHHRHFIKFLNEMANDTKIAQKRAAAAIEESERKRKKLETAEKKANGDANTSELYDPSEATGDDEDVTMKAEEDATMDDSQDLNGTANDSQTGDAEQDESIADEPAVVDEPAVAEAAAPAAVEEPKSAPQTPATPQANQQQQKSTPNNRNNRGRGTPRGRGRGRYNRY